MLRGEELGGRSGRGLRGQEPAVRSWAAGRHLIWNVPQGGLNVSGTLSSLERQLHEGRGLRTLLVTARPGPGVLPGTQQVLIQYSLSELTC